MTELLPADVHPWKLLMLRSLFISSVLTSVALAQTAPTTRQGLDALSDDVLMNELASRGLETLIHWGMAAADIAGVGEQVVRRRWKLGLVRSIPDLYRLTKEQLVELEGYGELSAQRTVDNIRRSKEQGLERLLFAVGLEEVGVCGRRRRGHGGQDQQHHCDRRPSAHRALLAEGARRGDVDHRRAPAGGQAARRAR